VKPVSEPNHGIRGMSKRESIWRSDDDVSLFSFKSTAHVFKYCETGNIRAELFARFSRRCKNHANYITIRLNPCGPLWNKIPRRENQISQYVENSRNAKIYPREYNTFYSNNVISLLIKRLWSLKHPNFWRRTMKNSEMKSRFLIVSLDQGKQKIYWCDCQL
jgi:hypothetical protein